LYGSSDALWGFSAPNQVVVRSGQWLQTYSLQPLGLLPQSSILLPEATAAVAPDPGAGLARVLLQVSSSRPAVQDLSLGVSAYPKLEGEPSVLLEEWRNRLAYDDDFAAQAGGL
jgi:hypothetical protein